ncbi:hypothetical protein [Verrucomicrobium sp. BvORR034]|uniref:hypothetical protein n=1 Tax=Verrucomicrobium sp. BvORR034 TaxID=1396418 RepID=UPI000678582C|nr:hypothetical protein [Verrucomicrobium sp. BvORR034]
MSPYYVSDDMRIAWIAITHIRKATMHVERWESTTIGASRLHYPAQVDLQSGEIPIVTGIFSNEDWYIWTTRRLLSSFAGSMTQMPADEIAGGEFGNFKYGPSGEVSSPLIGGLNVAALRSKSGAVLKMTYETGYAAMAPIYCLSYWLQKHPIMERLMTPSEMEAYRRRKADDQPGQ